MTTHVSQRPSGCLGAHRQLGLALAAVVGFAGTFADRRGRSLSSKSAFMLASPEVARSELHAAAGTGERASMTALGDRSTIDRRVS